MSAVADYQPMTDAQLVEFLNIGDLDEIDRARLLRSLTPQRRELLARMRLLEAQITAWNCGLGPKPSGVLMDFPRKRRRP